MNQHQQTAPSAAFALDTVHFLNRQTTDSDPFGDRDLVASAQTTHLQPPTMLNEPQLHRPDQNPFLPEPAPPSAERNGHGVAATDAQLLAAVKRQVLDGNPANFINVLLFWINFQVSRGMPNHNQVVLNVLQDMKNLFVARHAPLPDVVTQLNTILCTVVQNLNNDDYDSTESIVDFVQVVGVYFMKSYLFERQVVLPDAEAFDLLTSWIAFQYVMKRQTTPALENASNDEMLECMKTLEERITVPVV